MSLYEEFEKFKEEHPEVQRSLDLYAQAKQVLDFYERMQLLLNPPPPIALTTGTTKNDFNHTSTKAGSR